MSVSLLTKWWTPSMFVQQPIIINMQHDEKTRSVE
jgi:hypothetical protein